jgi:hypothetical protein
MVDLADIVPESFSSAASMRHGLGAMPPMAMRPRPFGSMIAATEINANAYDAQSRTLR